jgi:peptidoglycan/LPS O-acetylase OafA/YrhL
LVGTTLGIPVAHPIRRFLSGTTLRYIAEISFALYVVHGCLVVSWLDSGSKIVKYLKRPLYMLATWGLAHASTRYYESIFIRLGKRWA